MLKARAQVTKTGSKPTSDDTKTKKPVKLPDTKITRFGYIIRKDAYHEDELEKIRADLIVKPQVMKSYAKFARNNGWGLQVENGKLMAVPRYYGISKLGQPELNLLDTQTYPEFDMQYLGLLRPAQQVIVDKVVRGFEEHRGGVLIAGCGSGKTNMAIYIACKYKLKTLFIVHQGFLKNQVVERIRSTTNIQDVGIIQSSKVKVNSPFVVGMVQSLAIRDYDDSIFKDFGLVIVDEVHHMGARNFSKVFQKISARYMLGISAERQRADGLYKIINWYMGPFLHMEEQKPNDMVVVKQFYYRTSNEERSKVIYNRYTKEPDRSTMITNLVHIRRRNRFLYHTILELFDQGKNILVLCGRIKQVNLFAKLLSENEYTKNCYGLYLGGMTEAELAKSATKQIIIGTYHMAQEGLDIDGLNVVVLATPKSAIKQSIGRILRKEVYEEHPIVIDVIDQDNPIFSNQSNTRATYYAQQKYNIQKFKVADYPKDDHIQWDDSKAIRAALEQPVIHKAGSKTKAAGRGRMFTAFKPLDLNEIECLDDE
ncbi:ATP-dependent RNA helicase [uncultured virus]|nr:ATP-dependent RNA helicase [uncultured virus]